MRSLLQFTLDLFDPEPRVHPVAPKPRQVRPKRLVSGPNFPPTPVEQAQPAIESVATGVAMQGQPFGDVMPLASFRHPRANRESRLRNAGVA